MKIFSILLLSLMSFTLLAGNAFEMSRKGLYVGTTRDSNLPCSMEVLKIKKSLLTRRIQLMEVKVELADLKISETLNCSWDLEGTFCYVKNSSVHIGLEPKIGWNMNSYPDFFLKKDGKDYTCENLAL